MPDKKNSFKKPARLILEDNSVFEGISVGSDQPAAGEVVFNTGMVGYPETFTDPSYFGQILVLTYPLIGNYGVLENAVSDELSELLESSGVQIAGLVVSEISEEYSHWNGVCSLSDWLKRYEVPAITGIDTRELTKKLREKGTLLGRIEIGQKTAGFYDPNRENVVSKVSISEPVAYGSGDLTIGLLDCGCKHNIIRSLLKRKVRVKRFPWNHSINPEEIDGLVISNGPGNPKMNRQTIFQIRDAILYEIPTFGICLGHQLMALAVGADTFKLKYGHRSQNQPVMEMDSKRCLVTSQNHGFAVDNRTLPEEWEPWFINLNDRTNEGIRHASGRYMSVQFHPEAAPGPVDAGYLFDEFISTIRK